MAAPNSTFAAAADPSLVAAAAPTFAAAADPALLAAVEPHPALVAGADATVSAAADSVGSRMDVPRTNVVRAVPREGPITIDGRIDEEAWQTARPASGFRQVEPAEGEPAEHDTEVRILYDDEAIYVAARMYDSEPERIARQLTRRDEGGRAYDYFQVSFDTNMDRRTAYTFRVTAAGVQVDRYNFDDTRSDGAWTAVWESAVRVDELGWAAELRIPLSQLRYEPWPDPQTWGLQMGRRRIATNERTDWAFSPRERHGGVSLYGRLEGLVLPDRPRYLELLPYVLGGLAAENADPGDPFARDLAASTRAGLDVRYGLGSTFILDMALNPDFGQVQVDPRVINLTAFETFLPERRPFFSRDDRVFDFSLAGFRNTLFYSRRVGRRPHANGPDGAEFRDIPTETRILGAGKVTGRTPGGLTLGALAAMTDRVHGRAYFEDEDRIERFVAEPTARYGVVRIQQDYRDGESQVGGILTLTDRSLPGDGSLDWIPARALSAGLDFDHNWGDRAWTLSGFLAGTHVAGASEAIERLQRSANHYYQRPDQDYLTLDPDATSMTGLEWRLQLTRRQGRHWSTTVWAAQRTPGFEPNDIGFSRLTERVNVGGRVTFRQLDPGDIFRGYNINLSTYHSWRHELLHNFSRQARSRGYKDGAFSANANFTFLNWWGLNLNAEYSPEVLSDVLTRGGPLMVDPAAYSFSTRLSTDSREAFSYSARVEVSGGDHGAGGYAVSGGVTMRPTAQIDISLGPRFERDLNVRQYVTQTTQPPFEPTYGGRYLFADLDHRTFTLETELNVVLSPTLSLELFAQPLISSGDYQQYKQLAEPASFRFERFREGAAVPTQDGIRCEGGRICYADGRRHVDFTADGLADFSFPEQNFSVRSLRGNAVLRWEYRPGSELYFVWQQFRQDRFADGEFDLGRDARGLLSAQPDNVFMIKANYWIGR